MRKKVECKIFLNIYKLALEFSKSNEQILNELSHYLVDNLISKICIFIAQENDLTYQKTSSSGKLRTFDFPKLYKEILMPLYPHVPDYDREMQKLHAFRNLFQHGSESIALGIRSEIASEYVRLTEIILKEIGIVEEDKIIEPTNYLKVQYLRERPKDEYSAESRAQIDEEAIFYKIREIEKEFDHNIAFQKVKSELNIRIIVYPLSNRGELFSIREISELKDYLEREASYGPQFDGFPTPIFNDLSPNREGLQHIATTKLIGSILIQREGLVLYDWRYGMKKDPDNETLPIHLMASYVSGFLYFLSKFFNKVNYFGEIKIIVNISNISNWKYSRQPKFVFNRPKIDFQYSSFRPIERIFTIEELLTKEVKQRLLQEIFDEILLCYGDSRGYNLPESLKTYLEEH